MAVSKVNALKETIHRAYDSAKYFDRQSQIFRRYGGEEFLRGRIVSDLTKFYKDGMDIPQQAIRIENEVRFDVCQPRIKNPTFKEKIRNRYLNFLMDLRIKFAIKSNPELRETKAKFDALI